MNIGKKVDRSHYYNSLNHHNLIRNFNLFQPYKFSKFSDRLNTCIVINFIQILIITYVSFGNTCCITVKALGIY